MKRRTHTLGYVISKINTFFSKRPDGQQFSNQLYPIFKHIIWTCKENPLIINLKKSIFLLSALFKILDIARYNNDDQQELEIY